MKRQARTTSFLSESIHQRLNAYALAASAAGVGMLASAQPAEAKIVYTPTHHVIGAKSSFNLDLNHDGIIDFTIQNTSHTRTSGARRSLYVSGFNGKPNEVEGAVGTRAFLAAAIRKGRRIPQGRFTSGKARMAYHCSGSGCSPGTTSRNSGNWLNVTGRYLGLKFRIHGKTHYGWARLRVDFVSQSITATLTGYAYETIPGKPIIAGRTKGPEDGNVEQPDAAVQVAPTPEPASLGLLAQGASGLVAWRRRETQEEQSR